MKSKSVVPLEKLKLAPPLFDAFFCRLQQKKKLLTPFYRFQKGDLDLLSLFDRKKAREAENILRKKTMGYQRAKPILEELYKKIRDEPMQTNLCRAEKGSECLYFVLIFRLLQGHTAEKEWMEHPERRPKLRKEIEQLISQLYDKGFVMGDPNRGNFMRDKNGQWYIVDAGEVLPIGSKLLQNYATEVVKMPLGTKEEVMKLAHAFLA